jgi:hypothetical protein
MAIQKVKSPKGSLEWVTIDGEGKENLSGKMQYVANIVVSADDPILKQIDDFWAANKPKGFTKPAKSLGVYDHTVDSGKKDEDGKVIYEPDGTKYLAFKTGVAFPDGSPKTVQVYNAQAKKVSLPEGVKIGNGSMGKISGAMGVYQNKTKQGVVIDAGVTLYLDAIQIFMLEEFTEDAGFDAEEGEGSGWTGGEEANEFTGEEQQSTNEQAKPRL